MAAIEFLPVIALAALGARTMRNALALALAVPGVYVVSDVRLRARPVGLAFAFAHAILFALCIVLADRVAKRPAIAGIDGLAASMLIAAAVITPIAGWRALPAFAHPTGVLAGIGVGICSSVIPRARARWRGWRSSSPGSPSTVSRRAPVDSLSSHGAAYIDTREYSHPHHRDSPRHVAPLLRRLQPASPRG